VVAEPAPQNIAYVYGPKGAALELLCCRAPELLIEGPAGTGKTRAVLQKLHAVCEKYPKCRILILRDYRIAMNETVLVTYEDKVLPDGHPAKVTGGSRSHRQRYDYANGSQIVLGGLDQPERFMSGEYDIVYLAEGTDVKEEGKYEMVLTRLRNGRVPYQQAIVDCNPVGPGHWLNQRPERKRGDGAPVMMRLLSRHTDNPSLTADYLDTLANLTGVRRQRLFEGKWVAAEGLIYDFERTRHVKVVDTTGWPRTICGCDDGTHNPFAFLRARVSGDGHIHIEAERYSAGLLESAKVEAAKALSAGAESIEIDPAAAGLKLAYKTAGLSVRDANNDVLEGIAKVADRFAHNRITIDPGCVKLINEIEGYEWKDNAKKDEPVKENDHGCDGMRYLVARVDRKGGAAILSAYDPPAKLEVHEQPKQETPDFDKLRAENPEWGWGAEHLV
jgi:PBSX family phage terminase large subunit